MNIFQLIKTVLDEIYERISGEETKKDEQIAAKMVAIREAYKKLAKEGVPNDYSEAVTRFAYIYVYVTSHANIVYQLLRRCSLCPSCSPLIDLLKQGQVLVSSIGGGPGSDFLGILKYT